jgi:hypothetical protein
MSKRLMVYPTRPTATAALSSDPNLTGISTPFMAALILVNASAPPDFGSPLDTTFGRMSGEVMTLTPEPGRQFSRGLLGGL